MTVDFILNGDDVSVQAQPLDCLLDILRNRFKLKSLSADCREGLCGKCIVLMDGLPVNSCLVPAFRIRGTEVISYEGFMNTEEHAAVESAMRQAKLDLCPFCKPAYSILIGHALDRQGRMDNDELLELLSSVSCGCSDPAAIVEAARNALGSREGERYGRSR